MNRDEAERELCRLAVRGAPEIAPGEPAPHEVLLTLESLALTLDDRALRGAALGSLARARAERGEDERAEELALMSDRTGEATLDVVAVLGLNVARSFAEVTAKVGANEERPALVRAAPTWLRAAAFAEVQPDLSFLERFSERSRALILVESARWLGWRKEARDVARALLASEDASVVASAVEALAALGGLGPDEAAAGRASLLARRLDASMVDALVALSRVVELGEPRTEDPLALAVIRLALARRAAEEGQLERGRDLVAQVRRGVSDLRVAGSATEALHVFVAVLPLVAALHPTGAEIVESIVDDPLLAWAPRSAHDVLLALAGAATRLALPEEALQVLEDDARIVLRRIAADRSKTRVLFGGLGPLARAAALVEGMLCPVHPERGTRVAGPESKDGALEASFASLREGSLRTNGPWARSIAERIAKGARESLLEGRGLFSSEKPFFEYRALLGCGEALARSGDAQMLAGAIPALIEAPDELVPFLLDDALGSAAEVGSTELMLATLEVAKRRLEAEPVARWLAATAARASDMPRAAAARRQRDEELRLRARLAAHLR